MNTRTCKNCWHGAPLRSMFRGAFVLCRRFPSYERKQPADTCGEFKANAEHPGEEKPEAIQTVADVVRWS